MKTLTTILLSIALTMKIDAREVQMKTTISDVTVFQNGAQIKRTGSVSIPAGESEIKITDVTSLLMKESIQVKGEGNFTILSVNHQVILTEMNNEKSLWENLEARKKELMRKMEELSVKIQVLNSEEATIMNLQSISTTTKGVTVEQIGKAQEVVRIRLAAIKQEKLDASRMVLELFEEHKIVSQHLLALKTPKQKVSYEIIVKVAAKADTKGSFVITYIVPNAKWFPSYDLRVKSIADPLLIEYKANVTQETGENWSNVKLRLSTGDPSQSSEKPKIEPWWIYLNQNYQAPKVKTNLYNYTDKRFIAVQGKIIDRESGVPIPWCNITIRGTHIGAMADSSGAFSLALPEDANELIVHAIGYEGKRIMLNQKNLLIKLQKKEQNFGNTVKTDYDKKLMGVDSPIFTTDYEGKLTTLDLITDGRNETGMAELDVLVDPDVKSGGTISTEEYQSMSAQSINSVVSNMAGVYISGRARYANGGEVEKKLNIVNAEYTIEEKYTIPSDPKSISVLIQSIQADVRYQYFCAPRIDQDVFLTAQLVNWEQYNLLEGQANVFYEGTFTGNTFFDTRFLVDTLEISLGRDKGIKVERKKVKNFSKRQSLGNDIVTYRDWDISIHNAKAKAVDIIVEDQYPVSADSRITVTREESGDGKLNENTGVITWALKLDPLAVKNLELKYKVKFPNGSYVGLE